MVEIARSIREGRRVDVVGLRREYWRLLGRLGTDDEPTKAETGRLAELAEALGFPLEHIDRDLARLRALQALRAQQAAGEMDLQKIERENRAAIEKAEAALRGAHARLAAAQAALRDVEGGPYLAKEAAAERVQRARDLANRAEELRLDLAAAGYVEDEAKPFVPEAVPSRTVHVRARTECYAGLRIRSKGQMFDYELPAGEELPPTLEIIPRGFVPPIPADEPPAMGRHGLPFAPVGEPPIDHRRRIEEVLRESDRVIEQRAAEKVAAAKAAEQKRTRNPFADK